MLQPSDQLRARVLSDIYTLIKFYTFKRKMWLYHHTCICISTAYFPGLAAPPTMAHYTGVVFLVLNLNQEKKYIFIPELYLYSFIYLTRHTSWCQTLICADLAAYQHTCIHERGEEGARKRMNSWMRRRGGGGTLILLCHDFGAFLSFYGNKIATVSLTGSPESAFRPRQATARPEKSGKSLKSLQQLIYSRNLL